MSPLIVLAPSVIPSAGFLPSWTAIWIFIKEDKLKKIIEGGLSSSSAITEIISFEVPE